MARAQTPGRLGHGDLRLWLVRHWQRAKATRPLPWPLAMPPQRGTVIVARSNSHPSGRRRLVTEHSIDAGAADLQFARNGADPDLVAQSHYRRSINRVFRHTAL